VVVYSDKVEMEATLEAALLKVFGAEQPSTGPTGTVPTADAAQARKLFDEAIAAQREGDWATYGARIKELGEVLAKLAARETTQTK
jgi:uncharacterized membrane protein (UPF0182 family)